MELVNWSLNAIDKISSTRSSGSGEPVCPDGTFAAGYMRDSWEKWRVVCLAILSVEDIEDLYIFGTMITGYLLIGLGIALVYRKNSEVGDSGQRPQACLTFLKQWAELLALRLWSLTAIWITSWRSWWLCKGKWIVWVTRMDKQSEPCPLKYEYSP